LINLYVTVRAPDAQLTRWNKASYAIGDVADGVQGAIVTTFLLFYLTSAVGMAGSLAGLAWRLRW
jgi:Na+/melibiose symporter-like transporter